MGALALVYLKRIGGWLAGLPMYIWIILCLVLALVNLNYKYEDAVTLAADRLVVIQGMEEAAKKVVPAAKEVVTVKVTEYKDRIKYIEGEARVIEKQVPIYIPAGTPDLPGGFRLLHDAAAQGRAIAAGTAGNDAAPVAVEDAALTISDNYQQCLKDKEKLVFFQGLYKDLQVLYGTE